MAIIDVASVRVSPDTSRFREELRSDLAAIDETVSIGVELDTGDATAKLDAWIDEQSRKTINIGVDVDTNSISNSLERAVSDLSLNSNPLDRMFDDSASHGRGVFKTMSGDLSGDLRDVAVVGSTVGSGFFQSMSGAFGEVEALGGGIADEVGHSFQGVGDDISNAFSSIGSKGSEMAAQMAVSLLQMSLQVTLLVSQIYLIGSAILYAAGAVTSAIGAIGPAIGLLVVPITTVLAGMDGIKAAAKTIKPEFDALQKSVSDTFQKGLTPVFQNLATNLFPVLKIGMDGTATALSGIAATLGNVVTTAPNLQRIGDIFANVNTALGNLQTPLRRFVDEIIVLTASNYKMSQFSAFLGNIINQVTTFFQQIDASGQLDAGLFNLLTTLESISSLFTELLGKSLQFFNAAAPGVRTFFTDIKDTISKINFGSLGTAFGNMMKTIGDGLAKVPKSTWDNLVAAFNSLGTAIGNLFADGRADKMINFITQLVNFAGGIVKIGGYLGDLAFNVLGLANSFSLLPPASADSVGKTGKNVEGLQSPVIQTSIKIGHVMQDITDFFGRMANDTVHLLTGWASDVNNWISKMSNAAVRDVQDFANGIVNWAERGLAQFVQTVKAKSQDVISWFGSLPGRIVKALGNVGSILSNAGSSIMGGLKSGLESAWGGVQDFVGSIAGWIASHKGPISYDAKLLIPAGLAIMQGLHDGLQNGFSQVQTLVSGMGPQLATSLNASGTATLVSRSVVDQRSLGSASDTLTAAVVGTGQSVKDQVVDAMSGWSVQLDRNGLARLVNTANQRNARR